MEQAGYSRYEIIKDEKILRDFIDWLPELQENEKYYLCLFARNKYCKELVHIKSDKAQLKRFVTDKQRMINKIRQLEIAKGEYKQKDFGVPEEALALYITPNPRNMLKATVNTMVKLAQSIRDQNVSMNPHQEALSEIQKAKSRTVYVDFDIDTKDEETFNTVKGELEKHFPKNGYKILQTRGGYHILVEPSLVKQESKNRWYNILVEYADQSGDTMIPVPGCTQGGFIPHFINNNHGTIMCTSNSSDEHSVH